jgi:hypothetical protein
MNTSHRILTSLATSAIVLLTQGSPSLAHPFRSVQDYFLGLPSSLLPLGSSENRQHYLRYATVDVSNGYIRYQASDNPEQFEFAIFRKSNGQYLAAFSIPYDPDSFPEHPSLSQLILLDYQQGEWRNVTREILPVPVDHTLTYQLPQVGRDIVVLNHRQEKLYRLRWQNDRFVRLET